MKKTGLVLFALSAAVLVSACATQTREQAQAGKQALQALEEGQHYLRLAITASHNNDAAGACTYTTKAIEIVSAVDRSALDDHDRKIVSDTIDFGAAARDQICKAEGGNHAPIKKATRPTKRHRRS
jgi:hypothetical protein